MKHRPPLHPQDIKKYSQEQYLGAFLRVKDGIKVSKEESTEQDISDITLGVRYFRRKYALQAENILDLQQMIARIWEKSEDFVDAGIMAQLQKQLIFPKNKEEILRDNYIKAIESSAVVQIVDKYGIIQYSNSFYKQISGDKRNIIGKKAKIMGGSKYHSPEFWKDMWDTILSGKKWEDIIRNPRMDRDADIYMKTTIIPLMDKNGEYNEFISIRSDVTDLYEANQIIKTSRDRIENILNSTSQWFYSINEDLEILEVNDALCYMLGYNKDEIIGKTVLDFLDTENKKLLEQQIHKIKNTDHRTYDIKLLKRDGNNLPVIIQATTIYNKKGEIVDIIAFITDVSNLHEATRKDILTGINNRGCYDIEIKKCFTLLEQGDLKEISVAIFDIDHFKRINDTYGHDIGDMVLRNVWAMLRSLSNRKLSVFRYGGEEFVLIGYNMDVDTMKDTMENLRITIENTEITFKKGWDVSQKSESLWFTVSAGVIGYKAGEELNNTPEALFSSVDACLFEAKDDGRNCVKVCCS